jgi:hypothetical protein
MTKLRHPLTLAFALGFALWAGPALSQGAPIGPANWFACNNTAQVTGTANTSQQIVALATSPVGPGGVAPRIYVCGWTFTNTAAVGTVAISYGTGVNCGTGTTPLSPALSVGATQLAIYTQIPSLQTAPANALCVTTSVNTINGLVWYTQF